MKNILIATLMFVVVVSTGISFASAAPEGPLVVMGDIEYNYTGPEDLSEAYKANIAGAYNRSFEGSLINGGVSVGVSGSRLAGVEETRAENNEMNQGQGGRFTSTDAEGNKFFAYKKYEGNLTDAPYRVDTTINVWKLPNSDDRYDMNFNTRVIDVKTGEVVDSTSTWKRNTPKRVNEQYVGPEPTWMERNILGYAREVTYEDPLRTIVNETSKTLIGKLAVLSDQEFKTDAEKFAEKIEENKAEYEAKVDKDIFDTQVVDSELDPFDDSTPDTNTEIDLGNPAASSDAAQPVTNDFTIEDPSKYPDSFPTVDNEIDSDNYVGGVDIDEAQTDFTDNGGYNDSDSSYNSGIDDYDYNTPSTNYGNYNPGGGSSSTVPR